MNPRAASWRDSLRLFESQLQDPDYLEHQINFSGVLSTLSPDVCSLDDNEMLLMASLCERFLDTLYSWEEARAGASVRDTIFGEITTAEARRLLVRDVVVRDVGEVVVTIVDQPPTAGQGPIVITLRAEGDPVLSVPEVDVTFVVGGSERRLTLMAKRRGGAWYALEQLRDDVREGRLMA